MKIVGRTDTGFLVQISEYEIGLVAGFGKHPHYGPRKEEFRSLLRTDVNIAVTVGLQYIETLREKEQTVKQTAGRLRELADLLENSIPEIIAPPAEPKNAD